MTETKKLTIFCRHETLIHLESVLRARPQPWCEVLIFGETSASTWGQNLYYEGLWLQGCKVLIFAELRAKTRFQRLHPAYKQFFNFYLWLLSLFLHIHILRHRDIQQSKILFFSSFLTWCKTSAVKQPKCQHCSLTTQTEIWHQPEQKVERYWNVKWHN